jgi:hypothetical protein
MHAHEKDFFISYDYFYDYCLFKQQQDDRPIRDNDGRDGDGKDALYG